MSIDKNERSAILALHTLQTEPAILRQLKERFKTFQAALLAIQQNQRDLLLPAKVRAAVFARLSLVPKLEEICQNLRITLVTEDDVDYPYLLKQLTNPPPILYCRGSLPSNPDVLAVVGTRKPSQYGVNMTQAIIEEFKNRPVTIVSGLAFGIDAAAHRAALDNDLQTVAVLGSGLDSIYPTHHLSLAEKIIARGGGLISEFPLLTPPYPSHFLIRNRTIAGLAQSVLLIEAPYKSGAMNTVSHAANESRAVFALPGDITRQTSAGPNSAIANGATPVLAVGDLLRHYFSEEQSGAREVQSLSSEEQQLLSHISTGGTNLDQLAQALNLDIAAVSSKVIMLELKNLIRRDDFGHYRRIS